MSGSKMVSFLWFWDILEDIESSGRLPVNLLSLNVRNRSGRSRFESGSSEPVSWFSCRVKFCSDGSTVRLSAVRGPAN